MTTFEPEFDQVYTIDADGNIGESHLIAPYVESDPDTGEDVEGGWALLHGHTRQYGYNGAVMHPSEMWGEWAIEDLKNRERLSGLTLHFAVVPVESSAPDEEPVGWAVAYVYSTS